MINKQGLIFLTLTSLILVLSIYYVTMPNELLLTTNSSYISKEEEKEKVNVTINNEDDFTVMKSVLNTEREEELSKLKNKLMDKELGMDEKNNIYEEIQGMNKIKAMEEKIEKILKDEFELDSFIKIKNDVIEVTIKKEENDKNLTVKIMSRIEKEYPNMYISVTFKK